MVVVLNSFLVGALSTNVRLSSIEWRLGGPHAPSSCLLFSVGLLGPQGEIPTAEGAQASGHRGPFRSLFAYFRISSDHLASGLVVVSEECIPTSLDDFKIGLMISLALRGESFPPLSTFFCPFALSLIDRLFIFIVAYGANAWPPVYCLRTSRQYCLPSSVISSQCFGTPWGFSPVIYVVVLSFSSSSAWWFRQARGAAPVARKGVFVCSSCRLVQVARLQREIPDALIFLMVSC